MSASELSERPTVISAPLQNGFVDWVDLTATCLFRVFGWSTSNPLDEISLHVGGEQLSAFNCFRNYRPDVAAHLGVSDRFLGFGVEFLLPKAEVLLNLRANSRTVYSATVSYPIDTIRRNALRWSRALTRDEVYPTTHQVFKNGCPPPPPEPELLEFLERCAGPILDFGCGTGQLIQALRTRGLDARGLELFEMEPFVLPAAKDRIAFYDGQYPAPLPSGSFATVVCAEVLEHIVDYSSAIEEMARLTRDRVVISVPDNNMLPICQSHYLIPWHYLTGDHYNFFNQVSLVNCLRGAFRSVEVTRTTVFQIEGVAIYSNLIADCRK